MGGQTNFLLCSGRAIHGPLLGTWAATRVTVWAIRFSHARHTKSRAALPASPSSHNLLGPPVSVDICPTLMYIDLINDQYFCAAGRHGGEHMRSSLALARDTEKTAVPDARATDS